MKTKTYYIVEDYDFKGDKIWEAYRDSWGYRMFGPELAAWLAFSSHSADDCEKNLRKFLPTLGIEPKIVRVLKI